MKGYANIFENSKLLKRSKIAALASVEGALSDGDKAAIDITFLNFSYVHSSYGKQTLALAELTRQALQSKIRIVFIECVFAPISLLNANLVESSLRWAEELLYPLSANWEVCAGFRTEPRHAVPPQRPKTLSACILATRLRPQHVAGSRLPGVCGHEEEIGCESVSSNLSLTNSHPQLYRGPGPLVRGCELVALAQSSFAYKLRMLGYKLKE